MRRFLTPVLFDLSRLDTLLSAAEFGRRGSACCQRHEVVHQNADNATMVVAVPGFSIADLKLEVEGRTLTIAGRRDTDASDNSSTPTGHAGSLLRPSPFSLRFVLAEHVQIRSATVENGLLKVALERLVPEAEKPRAIELRAA